MVEFDDGGPAFPSSVNAGSNATWSHSTGFAGMSLWDWYVGKIVEASVPAMSGAGVSRLQYARDVVAIADALIAERRKREGFDESESK